ncbi:MAG: hypothetical protein IT428_30090 [Planctomycetaceae bacterium]|nr:hypothetical protein [Planctomycetaceae bacterium]
MRRIGSYLVLASAVSVTGCLNPMTTRLPELAPRETRSELRSLARHDPFPDPDLGPDTFARPRGFENERPAPRRLYEERLMQGQQPEFAPNMPVAPAASYSYPNVVH